jgi:hypothetical protein
MSTARGQGSGGARVVRQSNAWFTMFCREA